MVACRDRVKKQTQDKYQKQVEAYEHFTIDIDSTSGPDHRHQKSEEQKREPDATQRRIDDLPLALLSFDMYCQATFFIVF